MFKFATALLATALPIKSAPRILAFKWIYRTLRSLIFTVTLLVVGLFVVFYVLFSIPAFNNYAKDLISSEMSKLLGGEILIDELEIHPFNEVTIKGLEVIDPRGRDVLKVEETGAGISLWRLLTQRKIELSFGEIIGLRAFIEQEEKDGPLNISYIIEALKSKDDTKEKKDFQLTLRNVVLRKSEVTFRRPWMVEKKIGRLDLADLRVTGLAADISFPTLSNKGVEVDLRRLSMSLTDGVDVEKIALRGNFSDKEISIKNLTIEFPNSRIFLPGVELRPQKPGDFKAALSEDTQRVEITDSWISPSDFSAFLPVLTKFTDRLPLELDAEGNLNGLRLNKLTFGAPELLDLSLTGSADIDPATKVLKAEVSALDLQVAQSVINELMAGLQTQMKDMKARQLLLSLTKFGKFELKGQMSGEISPENKIRDLASQLDISSNLFSIEIEGGVASPAPGHFEIKGEINLEEVKLRELLPDVPVSDINANIILEGSLMGNIPEGMVSMVVEDFTFKGKKYDGLSLNLQKEGEEFKGDILIDNSIADVEGRFSGDIEGESKNIRLDMDLRRVNLSEVADMKKYDGYLISGLINLDMEAFGMSQFEGDVIMKNFKFSSPEGSRQLKLKELKLEALREDTLQHINLSSDWLEARVEGTFKPRELPVYLKRLSASVMPELIASSEVSEIETKGNLDFDIQIKRNNSLTEFFNLPVRLLVPINISGSLDGYKNSAWLTLDMPYLQQGKDKLIYDTKFTANVDGNFGVLDALIETNLPVKRGDLSLNVNLEAKDSRLSTDLRFINTENSDFKGHLILDTMFGRNPLSRQPEISLAIEPSVLQLGTADWHLARSEIFYSGKRVEVKGLRISHDDQFVDIEGVASPEYSDEVAIRLADIDVDYIFEMLQINYVTFGGVATGEITGHALLSGDPVAETESLLIKDFTYNGAALGDCVASSRWNNEEKEIEIGAKITQAGHQTIDAGGGIWIGRDSLSFDISARKVPVDFVQPFMSVFSSHVGGFATGDVKLFGTFHDIDMTGKIFADSVAVKLDYTNTIYHGSDSVYLLPGKIEIPHFRLYDKYGNSAMMTGTLTHRYFHDPSFNFRLTDAENFLCYDTSKELNPDWYGLLFGSGSAFITGEPGLVDISADMTLTGNSSFTFVLNETEYAKDYQFLTFSDKRAEEAKKNLIPTTRDIKEMLRRQMNQDDGSLSRFNIDIRATVTPQVLFTLVMDPAAGDKITARGRGAMQVRYESDDDEMMMYGKYEIDEGNYNFSLQDIILRDFKIKEGSYISFNGNPLAADLDISATYRVNTNLSDLDKSFSTDRDLNRTNVPVDAVLSVNGNMTSPDITFDIELPTLTQDVERKVKSIISTDDMMNRQIIYLLALNRFYTPEYMGAGGNNGELAAVASSTISSQLTNILGQLTDKFSVAPSFRSDKGDFSDIEVDVALSSRLLNNRLLINGNFGYRDRSTSSTTFVGDFDVEYLLSKNGNLRLKAYNHFNDQNYYLREALTTQGLGVVYRKDFDDMFRFLKRKRNED